MNENTLVPELLKKLRKAIPNGVIFKHADKVRSGIPDISVDAHRRTTWLEAKWANPTVSTKGIQHLTCLQLERYCGNCWYVVYGRHNDYRLYTAIALPSHIDRESGTLTGGVVATTGIDHDMVVEFVRGVHFGTRAT